MANPIEEDPELARAVGVLAGRWGLVEVSVEILFGFLSGLSQRKATIMFSFFKAVNTQRDIIRFMARETPTLSSALLEQIDTCLNEYVSLAADRNAVIHYPFGWDSEVEPPAIYKMARTRSGEHLHTKRPMDAKSVMDLADRVNALHEAMWACLVPVLDSRSASQDKLLPPSQDQIRGLATDPTRNQ
jgi:hypothetical protein